jgi:hypothetical protein
MMTKSKDSVRARFLAELDSAEKDAWRCLAQYKFWMFGYYAARWITINKILRTHRPNPWKEIVQIAKEKHGTRTNRN